MHQVYIIILLLLSLKLNDDDPNEGLYYQDLLIDFQESVKKVMQDTTQISGYTVITNYYSLRDTSYIMPTEFIWGHNIKPFPISNFIAEVSVSKDGISFLKDTISIKRFYNYISDNNLREYGTLGGVTVRDVKDYIRIDCNISTPITDIGINLYYDLYFDKSYRIMEQ